MPASKELIPLPPVRTLSRARILFALAVAVATDGLQLLLGPLGWVFVDPFLDVIAMGLTMWALGFHPLLLPTFIIKLFPIVDMPPTWTVCVIAVVALRKRAERAERVAQETYPAVPPKLTDRT